MTLSEQCCTLVQSKRLKELGITIESTFYWMPAKSGPHKEYIQYGNHSDAIAPAYNVSELGAMLPHDLGNRRYLMFDKFNEQYRAWYGETVFHHQHEQKSDNESQSRAAMLIHLLENKII